MVNLQSQSSMMQNTNSTTSAAKAIVNTGVRNANSNSSPQSPTFAFEHVAATLVPFDFLAYNARDTIGNSNGNNGQRTVVQRNHALTPILETNGLIFPYTPSINEGVSINYDELSLTHSNESYYAYKSTNNQKIQLNECIWTCDTFDNALYTLAVIHFFRTYSFMDFGRQRTGRPPSPMWFSAFGNYAFYRVPVLLQQADWSWSKDTDFVGIPEPGSPEYVNKQIIVQKTPVSGNYTWVNMKLTLNIQLVVQHAPSYWINWSLDDYRNGKMLADRGSFHNFGISSNNSTTSSGALNVNVIPPIPDSARG